MHLGSSFRLLGSGEGPFQVHVGSSFRLLGSAIRIFGSASGPHLGWSGTVWSVLAVQIERSGPHGIVT